MRSKKYTSKIILAATVAILAMLISYSAFSNMNKQLSEKQKLIDLIQKTQSGNNDMGTENYAYAVAVDNMKAGEIVSDEDVDFKQYTTVNPNAFENRSDVVNKVLLQDINSGNVFTTSHIAKISSEDTSLKEGYRALTLPADSFQGRSDKMTVGSNVDIYSASADSSWVLENIKIIDFEGAAGNGSSTTITNANAITFEVATNEITDFISNISKNKLVLVARNPNDKKVIYKTPKHTYHKAKLPRSYSATPSFSTLPSSLPDSPPIHNFSGLPQPIQPSAPSSSVEVIEANVKSKVTFD